MDSPKEGHYALEAPAARPTAYREIVLLGVICFACPGMFNALNGLGGGGQLDTSVASNANVALYACFAVFSFFAGTLHNLLGPKRCVLMGGLTYALYVAALLNYNLHGSSALVVAGGGLLGVGASLLWTAQGAMMLSYPTENEKGHFISTVNDATYIGFMATMVVGSLLALGLRRPVAVVRSDLSPVSYPSTPASPTSELRGLVVALRDPRVLCLLPAAFYSNFFYAYQFNDVNGRLFTLRSRGLNNALYWAMEMLGAYLFGSKLMDVEAWPRTKRAKVGLSLLSALCLLTWGLGAGLQSTYSRDSTQELIDFTQTRAIFPMIVYLLYGFLDAAFQTYVYWTIGALTNDAAELARIVGLYKAFQSAGGAVSWKIDVAGAGFMLQLGINWGLMLLSIVSLIFVARSLTK
ncbi:UNC93-like protein [Achlya hypogyna]|uniref:UNC93-like protein n=1 Tax=Achlya hypogyna TaxID=1202772 RepID=A0A1V9ZSM7_ACHHY|nr:UNC93-like protein [Achlya hypogyna]